MSKRLVLLFCALFVMAACVPAFAAVQNIKVSGDILARMINRGDFDLTKEVGDPGPGTGTGEDDISLFNSVVRLRVDAELTDNVAAVVRMINERNWDENTADSTDIDLDLAYVSMKEFLYDPLAITIGRQELHFGNDMIIGDGQGTDPNLGVVNSGGIGTNQFNTIAEVPGYGDGTTLGINGDLGYRKAFDAIRGTLNYDPLVIDIVFAEIDENLVTDSDNNDDVKLYGVNAGYAIGDKWNTNAEAYWWNKDVSGNTKKDRTTTLGGRVSTSPTEKLNLQQEVAWQGGHKVNAAGLSRDRNAWASQSMVTVVPGWKHDPTFGMVYSYFSGDSDPASANGSTSEKDYYAWDPMFENQTAGRIINALFSQWNAHNVDLMATLKPDFLEDVTVRIDWIYQAMAKAGNANSALTSYFSQNVLADGAIDFAANKKELGQELDLTFLYDYTEDVEFGLCMDWFFPGRALTTLENQKQVANEVLASCKVEF